MRLILGRACAALFVVAIGSHEARAQVGVPGGSKFQPIITERDLVEGAKAPQTKEEKRQAVIKEKEKKAAAFKNKQTAKAKPKTSTKPKSKSSKQRPGQPVVRVEKGLTQGWTQSLREGTNGSEVVVRDATGHEVSSHKAPPGHRFQKHPSGGYGLQPISSENDTVEGEKVPVRTIKAEGDEKPTTAKPNVPAPAKVKPANNTKGSDSTKSKKARGADTPKSLRSS